MADTKLIKSRGEHWVCSLLAAHGWAPALTRDGLERTDILAAHPEALVPVAIQVKAASKGKARPWVLDGSAHHPAKGKHEWFVLVELADSPTGHSRCFVVPRDHVEGATWISHRAWALDPAATRARNTGPDQSRMFTDDFAGYEDRWELLKCPTNKVPVRLSKRLKDAAESYAGYPPGSPWNGKAHGWDPPAAPI